jgi:glycosyltransferase involved in cell wall biosynthesis
MNGDGEETPDRRQDVPSGKKMYMFQNGTYGTMISGGDVHFVHQVAAANDAGFEVAVFGGKALEEFISTRRLAVRLISTDSQKVGFVAVKTVGQQLKLFFHYCGQFFQTLRRLNRIKQQDVAVAVTDAWFDVLPAVFSRAKAKAMLLGMDAPRLSEIARRSRPDITPSRVASIHYWVSQSLSLWFFRWCKRKTVFYVHPLMRTRLLKLGFSEAEIRFVSNGIDFEFAHRVAAQPKVYDVIWIGRIHPQKGIDDLFAVLRSLSEELADLRVVFVGQVEAALSGLVAKHGLSKRVTFAGFVSEEEKFRLMKSSRLFLMPSHYESWGIVIGEALACKVPVVAYDIEAYRPIFGNFLRYVPPFDVEAFTREAKEQIQAMRDGRNYLDSLDVDAFKRENSWATTRDRMSSAFRELGAE